jgi:Protein of unknown function (DUF4199)
MNKTLTYGLIIGVVMGAISFISLKMMGVGGSTMLSLVGFAVFIGLLVFFGTKMRTENGGYATFGKMFGWLMVMTIVASLLQNIVSIGVMSTSGSSAMDEIKTTMHDEMHKADMTDDEKKAAEMVEGMMDKGGNGLMMGAMIVGALVGLLIMTVINLILAAVLKKDPAPMA